MTIRITITNDEASKIRINELLVTRCGHNGRRYTQDTVEAGKSITVTVHKDAVFTLSQRYDDNKVEEHSSSEPEDRGKRARDTLKGGGNAE